jgi:hypothetical protein
MHLISWISPRGSETAMISNITHKKQKNREENEMQQGTVEVQKNSAKF